MIEIPFAPSIPYYRFSTTIEDVEYIFDVRWNSRTAAWYFDVLEFDETPIISGVKIVLGMYLGRRSTHRLFHTGVFVAVDTTRQHQEAGFDDISTRVVVRRYAVEEVMAGRGFGSPAEE